MNLGRISPRLTAPFITVTLLSFATSSRAQNYTGTPYGGSPAAVPGTIQAANFDNGGEGVAYHDTTPGNLGGAYRNTDVDITTSSEGGYTVGWIDPGEWLNFTVNVASSGSYMAQIRIAAPGSGTSLHIGFNGSPGSWTAVSIPSTGGWQTFTTVNVPLTLTAGVQQMTLGFDTGGYNVSFVTVTTNSSSTITANGLTPFGGSPAAVPGTIQAANFDNGGEGVAYHDTTPGNLGGAYRNTDVDIAASSEGGYTVGWIDPGEFLNFTVNVASSGSYTAQIRVAAPGSGTSLHIGFNGSPGSWTAVSIPSTGGWQAFTTVNVPLTLTAGVQQMTLGFDTGWYNVSYVNVVAGGTSTPVPTPTPPPPPPPPSSSGGGTIRVMTWNIDLGYTNDSETAYVLPQQVAFMATQNADVMILQEVGTWAEYQPSRIPALLQAAGQNYTAIWVPGTGCETSAGCAGDLMLSRLPVVTSNTSYAGLSGMGQLQVKVGGVPINILDIHLEYYDLSLRTTEENDLMSWATNFPGPRLVGGDFNSWWGEYWIGQMETQYSDTWVDVTGNQDGGYTTGPTGSAPCCNVRFDYWFRAFDGASHLTPIDVFVPPAAVGLSDHSPVVADFRAQ